MQRSTKIVATLGPVSSSEQVIETLARAGANLFRLNFSHGAHEEQARRVQAIRSVEQRLGRPIGILADLQGPKYRIGKLDAPLSLEAGQQVCFYLPDQPAPELDGNIPAIPLPHADIFASLEPKSTLLMDDGKLTFTVTALGAHHAVARLHHAGRLSSQKGVNLPDVTLDVTPLTEKDLTDLAFALDQNVEYIALSFVQRASDILDAKRRIGGRAQIIAKIEKPSALTEIDQIIQATDAVMVARGDLGVELPAAQVPAIQKQLVAKCRQVGKPVIVATQMLESMITSPAPTRAEASDVAGAVFEGADAVMLSAESAVGDYPEQAVAMMAEIACAAEAHVQDNPHDGPARLAVEPSVYHAVAEAAVRLAQTIEAAAIVAFTASGNTAVRLARERPSQALLVLSPETAVERRLSLLWGTQTAHQDETSYEQAVDEAVALIKQRGLARTGESIVLVSGMPFGLAGTTNALRVVTI